MFFVPFDKFFVLFLERRSSRSDEDAAEVVAFFVNCDFVSAKSCNSCDFHTSDTTADDGNLLGFGCGNDLILLGLHGVRIECATSHACGVRQILIVGNAVVVSHVEACVVAADARHNVVLSALHEFCHPFGIGEELACNAHTVNLAFRNRLCRDFGSHTACANDGNINCFFDFFAVFEVAVLRHIYRRMRPVPCVVRAVVGVEHIIACVLEHLCRNLALFHIAPDFDILFAGKCALTETFRL